PDLSVLDDWRGHSFSGMTGDLLSDLDEPLAELDLVVLAYQTPDLHVAEAAGCYLAHRCPGGPASFAISGPGPGSAFTALKVADSMYRCGVLGAGVLFVLDQTTPIREPGTRWDSQSDAAVLVHLGGHGQVEVHEVIETAAGDPAAALAEVMS